MKDYKLWIVLLALPAVGFTTCEYFSDVTVPAVDTTKPIVGSRVIEPGDPDWQIFSGSVSYETHDYYGHWVLAPYGYDSGGVQMLSVGVYADTRCCSTWDPNICAWTMSLTQALVDEEFANPGDTVSNGRFFWFDFSPSSSGGANCDIIRFGYIVEAMDFAGYLSSGSGTVTYTKPPMSSTPPIFPPQSPGNDDEVDPDFDCDFDLGTSCWEVPAGCQDSFQVKGTWVCINGNDKCQLPPEGAAGSYCNGPWEGEGGSNNPKANCGLAYGLSCEAGDCYPGTICNLQYYTGTKCGLPLKNPTTGEYYCTIPRCWPVNEKANLCAEDWILPPPP